MSDTDRRELPDRRTVPRGDRRISDIEKTRCPRCGSRFSCVVDSEGVHRRRECECGWRYNTTENVDDEPTPQPTDAAANT